MPNTFLEDCGGPFDLTPDHTITSWESMPTSPAETAIIKFLKSERQRYVGKRLLHVGIGNSSLPTEFSAELAEYVGITISFPEIAQFERNLANAENARAILLNKYDPRMYSKLSGTFEIIIDTLLKSFSCCEKHFEKMMEFFVSKLSVEGMLLTTEAGLRWGWRGNTKVAHTPGAQTDPSIGQFRTLGFEELGYLCERLNLSASFTDVAVDPGINDCVVSLVKKADVAAHSELPQPRA